MRARDRAALLGVARGERPADRYVRGGQLLNVWTGEVYPANVAIAGERIAYVGFRQDMLGPRTEVIEAAGHVLVPGYIEPHAHPWNLVTPAGLARHVLPLGTTTIFGDNLTVYSLGGVRGVERAAAALARGPVRFYWTVRPHGQSRIPAEQRRFPVAAIRRMLGRPWAAALGEVTRWPEAWAGERWLLDRMALARAAGKRVEGHAAGAGAERLAVLAAAGFTSDHEAITGQEALERARLGIAVMLRQSSLRPDLRGLLAPFVKAGALGRLMLTTDGSTPAFTAAHGFVDNLVRLALDEGVPPADAYRMVTLNPATYYGKDADLGGIAPGRCADILLLGDLADPRPRAVIARGRLAAREGQLLAPVPEPPWGRIFTARSTRLDRRWRAAPEEFEPGPGPVMRLVSAVITAAEERGPAPGDLRAALLDRRGRWITLGWLAGFATRLDGLATTLSTDYNILALGQSPRALAVAVNRLLGLRGGAVLVEGERVALEVPLPIGGTMSLRPLEEVARQERALRGRLEAAGYPFHDPIFTCYFLSADFLPAVRLTPRGIWDVKRRRVLQASRPR